MGCVFCASGLNGVVRNLTTGEILEQLVRLRNLTDVTSTNPDRAPRLTHVVVMGMGEPLANLDNLLEALAVAGDKNGLGIGARHITISTVGLPAKIRQLAESGKQYHLAVSLHAPNDELRTRIVPTNDKTGLDAILAAADYFYAEDRPAGDLRIRGPRRAERPAAPRPAAGGAAHRAEGAREPDPVERRGRAAVPPPARRRPASADRHAPQGRREREGAEAQGVRDRRRLRPAPPREAETGVAVR